MKLLVATGNKGKLVEFRRILEPLGVEVLSPADVSIDADIEETGTTFMENAIIKAKAMNELAGLPAIADDSGLCVDALDGGPGVYSARYMPGKSQAEKNLAIINQLDAMPEKSRAAHFCSAICCVINGETAITAEGRCDGEIAREPSGDGGFGYDPIFLAGGKSFAELNPGEKDAISHRGRALRDFAKKLEDYLEKIGD